MSNIRVVILGALPMLRNGIRQTLNKEKNIEVVGEAGEGPKAVAMTSELVPHVVVVDASIRELRAPVVVRQIKDARPEVAVVVIVESETDEQISSLIQAGAEALLLRTTDSSELIRAIRTVWSGKLVLESGIGRRLLQKKQAHLPHAPKARYALTAREAEILRMVARAMTSLEIAEELGINQRTVKAHLSNSFGKLGVRSRTEAVLVCLKSGQLSLEEVGGGDEASFGVASGNRSYVETSPKSATGDLLLEAGVKGERANSNIGQTAWASAKATQDYLPISMNHDLSQALFEQMREGCFLIQDEAYVFVSRTMAEQLGYSQSEIIGKPFVQLIPLEIKAATVRAHRARISGEKLPEQYDFKVRRKDGAAVLMRFSVRRIVYKGRPAIVGSLIDANRVAVSEEYFRHFLESSFSS